jgi:hypothetical protein
LNSFEEKIDDVIHTISKDLLEVLFGQSTRSRAKKLKDTFNRLI